MRRGWTRQTLGEFEADLKNNLYKIWNRMSSGSYFPPPVRAVEIPKPHGGGVRMLGVPTVADRVAQTVVAMYLEERAEPGSTPTPMATARASSALDAVGVCRERCWKIRLGDRPRRPEVLRHGAVGPRRQGGGGGHRRPAGCCCM